NPTGATGQLKPIRDQEVMLSQPQDNPLLYNPTCVQLHTSKGASVSLPKHSYWFDFWVFVVFDIAFFLVMYFIVP
uniref:Uncharacterized protein n=1 Tax=Acanthochromis polyacanthus TaxID=80966 RepID=A0A3Q1GIQ1_9TELE